MATLGQWNSRIVMHTYIENDCMLFVYNVPGIPTLLNGETDKFSFLERLSTFQSFMFNLLFGSRKHPL